MSLAPALEPTKLYSAREPEVNEYRPLFTGDIFTDIDIPGVGKLPAMIIGHPCSMRGRNGALADQIPVAAIKAHEQVPKENWATGFYNRMPLEGLPLDEPFHAAHLDLFGLSHTTDILDADRIACLSHLGINQLQQRLVFHQTRLEVPTGNFQQAFDHTYEEADLLEEWSTDLSEVQEDPVASFEKWVQQGNPSRQSLLETPEQRAPIRSEMRKEIQRLKQD